jgi:dsRNA-specific ribonuclease
LNKLPKDFAFMPLYLNTATIQQMLTMPMALTLVERALRDAGVGRAAAVVVNPTDGEILGTGNSSTKKQAEQNACKNALEKMV